MSTVTDYVEPGQKRIDDPSMPKGQVKVVTPGVKGETETTFEEMYEGDKLVGRKQVSERVIKPAVDEVVKVGTGPANGGGNPGGAVTKQTVEKTETIGFSTSPVRDSSLSPGQRVTKTEGRAGSRVVKYELTMKDGKVIDRKVLSKTVTRQPVNRVVAVGPAKPKTDPVRPRMPWHCPSCGKALSGSQQFCPDDGTRRPGG